MWRYVIAAISVAAAAVSSEARAQQAQASTGPAVPGTASLRAADMRCEDARMSEPEYQVVVSDRGLADGTHRVIHFFEKQRLCVRQVAGEVKGQVLPLAIGESVITRNHAFQHESGRLRLVALPHQVFVLEGHVAQLRAVEPLHRGRRAKECGDTISEGKAEEHDEPRCCDGEQHRLIRGLRSLGFAPCAPELRDENGNAHINAPGHAHRHKDHDLDDADSGNGLRAEAADKEDVDDADRPLEEARQHDRKGQ